MTNADKFKTVFGIYSEEFWAKPEGDMLNWINSEYQEPKSKVDIQPVKYGWWGGKFPVSHCSICNATMILDSYGNYCPNCGAKMDGEENV